MSEFNVKILGLKEFQRAIKRNPVVVQKNLKVFFLRAITEYRRIVIRTPWRIGRSGGGAPVDTGKLRESYQSPSAVEIRPFEARFRTPLELFNKVYNGLTYPQLVHSGTMRMQERPWMDYAFNKGNKKIKNLEKDLLKDIVKDLAR